MKCRENRLRITRMKRMNNEWVFPEENEEFTIRVESCYFRQYLILAY